MEIRTSPHRPASTPWVRLVVLVAVLAPVSALVLLPMGLGLERFVMSSDSMDGDRPGGIPRGALLLERRVPATDLRPGDVITVSNPTDADREMVTHRIVSIGPTGIRTQGDANPAPDPWVVRPQGELVPTVVMAIPWVGYAYLLLTARFLVLLAAASAFTLAVVTIAGGRRRRRTPLPSLVARAGGQP